MNSDTFETIVSATEIARREVRMKKAKWYSRNDERLHNFHRAAALKQTSPERALEGMLTKHLVLLYDLIDDVDRGKHRPVSTWKEAIYDAQNYLDLLHAMILERYGVIPEEE